METLLDQTEAVRTRVKKQVVRCPQTAPVLGILNSTPLQHLLRFADIESPELRKKPKGAAGLHLYIAKTKKGLAPLSDARFYRVVTRSPISISFEDEDENKDVTYYGRWVSNRGETGPWSEPLCLNVIPLK